MIIGYWNVTSWDNKDQEIIMEVKEKSLDICAI